MSDSDRESIAQRRKELRAKLAGALQYYRREKRFNRNLFYGFQIGAVVCGFAASALAAVIDKEPVTELHRILLILLPLLATTLAAAIQQFSWRELYELREQGRLEVMDLLYSTKFTRPETLASMTELERETYKRLIGIGREQSAGFFSFVKVVEADSRAARLRSADPNSMHTQPAGGAGQQPAGGASQQPAGGTG